MSEEFEIENFEDLMNVFENTGDFGKYYLGDYSNIQIANYLRKMQQENKQLKERNKEIYDGFMVAIDEVCETDREKREYKDRIDKAIEYIKEHQRKDEILNLNEQTRDLIKILGSDNNE